MKILRRIFRRPFLVIPLLIIAGIVILFWLTRKPTVVPTAKAVLGTIIEEVTVTGKTKPVKSVDLAFEKTGRVSRVDVAVGSHVAEGQILVELAHNELSAQLQQAEATLAVQQANLADLRRGSRPEDIQIKQTELAKAEQDLLSEYADVPNALNDAYAKADDAVRKQIDELFINDETGNPQLTLQTSEAQTETDVEFKRFLASQELKAWRNELDPITIISPSSSLDAALVSSITHLSFISNFLNRTMDAVVAAIALPQATITTYKTSVATARTNVSTALQNVNAQSQTIASQKLTVKKTNDELRLKLAGTAPEQIAAQEAQVRQAEANTAIIRAQIANTILRSPLAGVVTKANIKVGEIVGPNISIISVISANQLEIEANVPEADVAKIKIGNAVRITFDAYGDETKFAGHVTFIDPAETVIEGVPTYKTTIELDVENPLIKPGLTANLDIVANIHEGVIVVPQRSIAYRNGDKVVLIYKESAPAEERKVETGLRGSDGNIEILSGLAEGELIVRSPE